MTDPTHTAPWAADELLIVDDIPCVYTAAAARLVLVRLPGGAAATVARLRAMGHEVTLPRRLRTERPVPHRPAPALGPAGVGGVENFPPKRVGPIRTLRLQRGEFLSFSMTDRRKLWEHEARSRCPTTCAC